MKIGVTNEGFDKLNTELLVVGMFEKEMSTEVKKIDKTLLGAISSMVKKEQFKGEWKQAEILNTLGNMGAERVLLVGLGKYCLDVFSKPRLRAFARHNHACKRLEFRPFFGNHFIEPGKETSALCKRNNLNNVDSQHPEPGKVGEHNNCMDSV